MIREIPGALLKYLKLSEGLAYFHRMPLDPDYRGTLRRYLENREANFLEMVRNVLAAPEHPYAQLFEAAGCGYADLESGVRRNGLEATLEALLEEGVYLTLDEFRCMTGIVRGGRHIPAKMTDWDNARGKGPLQNISSGSSGGKKLRTHSSLEYAKFGVSGASMLFDEFIRGKPAVIVLGSILPSGTGLTSCMSVSRLGHPAERWFTLRGTMRQNGHYQALTAAIAARLRLGGANIPYPTYLEKDDFSPVAEFVARRKKEGVPSAISGMVSSVARVAGAALDRGLDIRGTFALVSGESLTDVKRDLIESAGINVYPAYGTTEFGSIGSPCRQMKSGDASHIAQASIALVGRRMENPFGDEEVNSLHITSLLSFAPRVLINVEIGDTGVIEPATCDCEFSRLGYHFKVRDIAAFSKICGQGVTMHGTEIVRLLEEGLPKRFGGRPGDYQLLEVEGKAQTEMVLRIHPRLSLTAPDEVLAYFVGECKTVYGGALAVLHWTQSNGLRVEIKEPVLAHSGKFRAMRLLGSGTKSAAIEAKPVPAGNRAGSVR